MRQTLHEKFLRNQFIDHLHIILQLSQIQVTENDFDDIVTVCESLDQIARTYKEASGDSLDRDKRILESALEFGHFELEVPSLVSGLEMVELCRLCMTMKVNELFRIVEKSLKDQELDSVTIYFLIFM